MPSSIVQFLYTGAFFLVPFVLVIWLWRVIARKKIAVWFKGGAYALLADILFLTGFVFYTYLTSNNFGKVHELILGMFLIGGIVSIIPVFLVGVIIGGIIEAIRKD